MLNLEQRTEASVQVPDEQDGTLFYNNDGDLVIKQQNGTLTGAFSAGTAKIPVFRTSFFANGLIPQGFIRVQRASDNTLSMVVIDTTGNLIDMASTTVTIVVEIYD